MGVRVAWQAAPLLQAGSPTVPQPKHAPSYWDTKVMAGLHSSDQGQPRLPFIWHTPFGSVGLTGAFSFKTGTH